MSQEPRGTESGSPMTSSSHLQASPLSRLDRLIPPELLDAGAAPRRRARILVASVLLCMVLSLGGIPVDLLTAQWTQLWITLVQLGTWAWVIPLLWWLRRLELASHLLIGSVLVALVAQVLLAGHQPLALTLLSVVPMAAVWVGGARAGWIWLGVLAACVWPLAFGRWGFGPEPALAAWISFALGAVLFGVMATSEHLRDLAVAQAEAERERAERASARLRGEQERFRALAEDSYQLIAESDTQGNIRYANPRYRDLLGYDPSELIGRRPADLLHPEDSWRAGRDFAALVGSGRRFEIRHRHRNESWVPIEFVASRYFTDEGTERWIFAGRDVSREKAERERLQASQKLESVGVLAGGVAHDFNNLLTVIGGWAEELPDSEAAREIRRAVERAAELTGQLLAFGRKQILHTRRIQLGSLLREMEAMLRSVLREEVHLELDLAEDAWPVEVDPGQMQRVIVNLATNARDALDGGGWIRFRTRNQTLDAQSAAPLGIPPGDYLKLTVEDGGRGMGEETLGRAFEPFFTTKAPGEGSGLGLSSVYGIVEQSGGGISLRSTPEVGTTAEILLPRSTRRDAEAENPPLAHFAEGSGQRILVVEDEPAVRQLVATTLARAGYEIVQAGGPREALHRIEAGLSLDLLVSDVIMP